MAEKKTLREIDALVAVHIMGLRVLGKVHAYGVDGDWILRLKPIHDGESCHLQPVAQSPFWPVGEVPTTDDESIGGVPLSWVDVVPEYSTDPAAAWSVVKKMRADGWEYRMGDGDGFHTVEFGRHGTGCVHGQCEIGSGCRWANANEDAMPLAVCLAALKAVGVEVEVATDQSSSSPSSGSTSAAASRTSASQ